MIILDVDGVLTDAGLMIGHNGFEYMKFDVQDGAGIIFAQKVGYKFALITGRNTEIINSRAKMLGIADVFQKQISKIEAYNSLLQKYELTDEEVCYVGDDILDIPLLSRVGFAVVPANGVLDAKKYADYVTKRKGGEGAVREVIDLMLNQAGLKKKLLKEILEGHPVGQPA